MTRAIVAGIAILVLSSAAPNVTQPSAPPAPSDPTAAHAAFPRPSSPETWANRERLRRAVERFEHAGLELPDVDVEFSESDDSCRGHFGLFDSGPTPWRVSVCSELEFVLTHELAHAWIAENLDEARRTSYIEHRGLSAWGDPDLPWRERGTEDAAFVMQQVLMAKRVRYDTPVWIERIAAYEQLTGRPAPQT